MPRRLPMCCRPAPATHIIGRAIEQDDDDDGDGNGDGEDDDDDDAAPAHVIAVRPARVRAELAVGVMQHQQ